MYPKNNASPERIAVGAIYQISDGAIQTTGASVRVMPQGGAAGAGGGTLACDTTSGIWHYTPTQAETNYTSFMVLVYKANCTSANVTVVTTAESTAGKVSLGGTQTANITGNLTGNVSGSVGSVTGAVGSVTGNVGGNVSGSVGSVSGHTPQTGDSYARLGAPAGASVSADIAAIPTNPMLATEDGSSFTAVVWNAAWDAEVQSEVQDAIEANHLDHLLAATYDPASKPGAVDALLNELVENDGGVSRFTSNSLEQAPGGSGGDATEAKQDEILEDLVDIKGTGFVKDTNSLTNLSSGATTNLSTEGETIVSSEG